MGHVQDRNLQCGAQPDQIKIVVGDVATHELSARRKRQVSSLRKFANWGDFFSDYITQSDGQSEMNPIVGHKKGGEKNTRENQPHPCCVHTQTEGAQKFQARPSGQTFRTPIDQEADAYQTNKNTKPNIANFRPKLQVCVVRFLEPPVELWIEVMIPVVRHPVVVTNA